MASAKGKVLFAAIALVIGVGFVIAHFVGRSSASTKVAASKAAEGTGAVALELQLGRATFNTLSWTVANGAFARMGSIDASKGETVRFVVGGLPAAAGYTLALVGTTSGATSSNCIGTAGFDVVANATSPVVLGLVCGGGRAADGRSGGALALNATPIRPSCAAVIALSVSPSEADVGSSILLAASAMSGAGSSVGLTFAWNVVGGTGAGSFNARSSAAPTFTCTQAGPISVAVTATTGSGGACAGNARSATFVCDVPPSAEGTASAGVATGKTKWWWSPPESHSSAPGGDFSVASNAPGLSAGTRLAAGGDGPAAAGGTGPSTGGGSEPATAGGAPPGGGSGGLQGSPCAPFNNPEGAAANGCTPTEQRFVDKSVECYTCLVDGSCLDDLKFGDTGKECGDLTDAATGGSRRGTDNAALCLATIDCILATSCASTDVTECYCGSLLGSACATAARPGDGACAQVEAEGSKHLFKDPASTVSPLLADVTLPAGKAGAIFHCGNLNGCGALCSQ